MTTTTTPSEALEALIIPVHKTAAQIMDMIRTRTDLSVHIPMQHEDNVMDGATQVYVKTTDGVEFYLFVRDIGPMGYTLSRVIL